jgi:hypothetical protein
MNAEPDLFTPRQEGGFAIETGIPVPTSREPIVRATWNPGAFPFDLMLVGQSFAVPPPPGVDLIVVQNRVSGAASKLHRETNKRFTTRQCGDVVRCWRIA